VKVQHLTWRWLTFATLGLFIAASGAVIEAPASHPPTQPSRIDEANVFQFRGRPIHPACVMQLGTELSDSFPAVGAVDVAGCTDTRQHLAVFTVRDGWIRMDLKDGGWFAYRHLGVSSGGTHVLQTQSSGGGTGLFEDLLLIRFHRDRVRENGKVRDRLLITSVGSFTLGDRDDGEITFGGNKVILGHSRYRKQDTVIPLDADQ
jgi:hypothetical protein